ncbi:cellulase family glycosylhydrolase [Ferruginibacter sp.]
MNFSSITLLLAIVLYSCKKKQYAAEPENYTTEYSIVGDKIFNYKNPLQLIGANALHVFSAGSSDMNSWNIDIAREFVGNVKESPVTGNVLLDGTGAYLHPLQSVVDSNRKNKRVTIICPFRWDGLAPTDFTGKMPRQTFWWNDLKIKLQQWAIHFKDQPDVWIELWNEPYRYDRADGYTDDIWLSDMNELTAIIRNSGNKNIIAVPCAEQGQDESVLINKGAAFLKDKSNIIFDIHAYEKWLLVPAVQMGNRLQLLQQNNLPVIFGETAPLNAGVLMDKKPFLDSLYNRGLSVCAWVWKNDGNDTDALLDAQGLPNDKSNNQWGSTYKALCLKARKP